MHLHRPRSIVIRPPPVSRPRSPVVLHPSPVPGPPSPVPGPPSSTPCLRVSLSPLLGQPPALAIVNRPSSSVHRPHPPPHMNKWDTSLAYSNAFFIAGCLVIAAGALSRLGAGQEWNNFQLLHAESFREMSSGERANFIINASSSVSMVILGLLSGVLLILISVLVTKMF
jgi:hypothetical protein